MSIAAPIRKSLLTLPRIGAPWLAGTLTKTGGGLGLFILDRDGDARATLDLAGAADATGWGKLAVAAAQRPLSPHVPALPRRLVVDEAALVDVLTPVLAPLRITVELAESPVLAAVRASVTDFEGPLLPALPDMWRHLFTSASLLAQLAPWNWFDRQPEFAIPRGPGEDPQFAVMMGGLGETFGFALYRNHGHYLDDMATRESEGRVLPHRILELGAARRAPALIHKRAIDRRYAMAGGDFYPLVWRVSDAGPVWDGTAAPDLAAAARALLGWCDLAAEGQPFERADGAAWLHNREAFVGLGQSYGDGEDWEDELENVDMMAEADASWEVGAPGQPPRLVLRVDGDDVETIQDAIDDYGVAALSRALGEETLIIDFGAKDADLPMVAATVTTLPDAEWLHAAAVAGDAAKVVLQVAGEALTGDPDRAAVLIKFENLDEIRRELGLPEAHLGTSSSEPGEVR